MGIFSSESTLILKNWEAVHDIFIAEKQLRKELLSFLYSIEADLKKRTGGHANGFSKNQREFK